VDILDYTLLLPPLLAILLSVRNLLRNPQDRSIGDFLYLSLMLAFLLEVVWLAAFSLYSAWISPARVDLWAFSALTGIPAWFAVRTIQRILR
jgi:hypothetical protein